MSGQLADSLEALYNARIPRDWLAKSWESSTLGNWFSGLLARHEQLAKWLSTGRPKAYWLTGFFNPQVLQFSYLHNLEDTVPKIGAGIGVNSTIIMYTSRFCDALKKMPLSSS